LKSPDFNLFEQIKDRLKDRNNKEEIDGFIHLPAKVIDAAEFEFYARNVGNFDLNRQIHNAVNEILVDHRIKMSNLDRGIISSLMRESELRTVKITKSAEEREGGFVQEYFSTFTFVMILYITIIIYGMYTMRSIIQEKNSRVIEILLSSANSFQLMVAKIIGLGSVGFTQYLIWSLFGIGLLLYGSSFVEASNEWFSFSPMLFIYFIIFFILGYFFYATIYAGIGAITNSEQEAQQLSFPVVLLIVLPIIMMTFIVRNPDSTTAVILSLIPFFSPIIMFARVNILSPPLIEIWGAIIILILCILILMWIVARIYRIGILMYGKRPTLPEVIKWIKAK